MNKNKKILITGTSGFIGFSLTLKLLKKGHKILGYDSINDYYNVDQKLGNLEILKKYKNFSFKKDDIVITKIIEEIKPDVVVNLAAMAGVRYSLENPELYMRVNIEGQINLLKQSSENNVKLFIYSIYYIKLK